MHSESMCLVPVTINTLLCAMVGKAVTYTKIPNQHTINIQCCLRVDACVFHFFANDFRAPTCHNLGFECTAAEQSIVCFAECQLLCCIDSGGQSCLLW